jgi:hypothetical protein
MEEVNQQFLLIHCSYLERTGSKSVVHICASHTLKPCFPHRKGQRMTGLMTGAQLKTNQASEINSRNQSHRKK